MRVLMVNKFFYIKGGSETYYFALKNLLEQKGHIVIDFSMQDEKNISSPYEEYFVKNIDYERGYFAEKIRAAKNIIYSSEAKKKFEKLVIDTKPDLIHLHIFQHQLSPSILDVIKKHNIPTVYTAHDLKMLCLNYKMMHHRKICEDCNGSKYYNCAKNQCVKDSFAKSCINVAEGYFHKWRKSYDVIDEIITPSDFYRKKFIEYGISEDRVIHIPNFLDTQEPEITISDEHEKYYLYVGRLSEEKGVLTLIKAFEKLNAILYIAGTGPVRERAEQYVNEHNLSNIEFKGFMSGRFLKDIVGNAKAIILPSEWYENGPYSAIEALQLERPVIGANVGGIPELVDGNGFLFESGNVDKLCETIEKMEAVDKYTYAAFKNRSHEMFCEEYTAQRHYERLKAVYDKAINEK